MKNKILIKFFIIILSIISVLGLLSNSISDKTNDITQYEKYSIRENLTEYVGVNQDTLENMYSSLIEYINGGNEKIITSYFNQREVSHMRDVKGLFDINKNISLIGDISLLIIYVYLLYAIFDTKSFKNITNIEKSEKHIKNINLLIKYSIFTLVIFLFIAILGIINFNALFIKFHELFFKNDLWLLNPKTDIMIRMLPEGYFMEVAKNIFIKFLYEFAKFVLILTFVKYILRKRS